MNRFPLSAMLTSLPLEFGTAVETVAQLGFTHADIVALAERPGAHREALADSGLLIGCASLGRGLPEGHGLDVASLELRRATLDVIKRQITDAAELGATRAYLVPSLDDSYDALLRFADGVALLADFAKSRMIHLCVEAIPGRALPSAAATLAWLESSRLDEVRLLLDVGHCLISKEDLSETVRRAGQRLGYVHLDDNDGVGDVHWALFTGRLTEEILRQGLVALHGIGYEGPLAFEFNAQLPYPEETLRQGKVAVERLLGVCRP